MQRSSIAIALLLVFSILAECKDLYKILGVDKDADQRAIRKAYHKLSLQYHPDKNKAKDAQEKFAEISNAYEILGDEKKRKEYDLYGDTPRGNVGGDDGAGNGFFQRNFQQQHQDQGGNPHYQQYFFHSEGPSGFSFENFGFGGFGGFGGFASYMDNDVFGKFFGNSNSGDYGSQLQQLNAAEFTKQVLNDSETWLLLFVSAAGRGRRAEVLEDFSKHMNGVIKVGIIDCQRNKLLCKEQRVTVVTEPKLYICPWTPSGKRSLVEYTGEWKVKALEIFSVEFLPRLSTRITGEDYTHIFDSGDGLPRAVLLTKKKETPAMWKALSGIYHRRVVFLERKVSDTSDKLAKRLKVTKLPAVVGVLANSDSIILSQGTNIKLDDLKALVKDLETKNRAARKRKTEAAAASSTDGVSKLTKESFTRLCSESTLCVIAVTRSKQAEDKAKKILLEVSRKNIRPATRSYSVPVSYVYVDGASQAKFLKAFGDKKLEKEDLALVALKFRKRRFATHTGPFTSAAIETFVSEALNGDMQFQQAKREPSIS